MYTEAMLRGSLLSQTVDHTLQGRSVLLSGPTGSGRSHLLGAARKKLHSRGRDAQLIDCADRYEARSVTHTEPGRILLLDHLEHADPVVTERITERLHAGGVIVAALDTSHRAGRFIQALRDASPDLMTFRKQLGRFQTLELAPLSTGEMARFVHQSARRPLNSAEIDAIVALAEGRPSWAVDLLKLHERGLINTFPTARVSEALVDTREYSAMRSLNRALGRLSPHAAAAARTLVELESFDVSGAEALVGSEATQELLKSGALTRADDTGFLRIAPFLAAAVSTQADTDALERDRATLQARLLNKASFGVPLTHAESLFCIRPTNNKSVNAAQTPINSATQSSLVHRVIGELIEFGDDAAARKLLLRVDSHELPKSELYRAKVLSAFAGVDVGLAQLGTTPEPHTTAPPAEQQSPSTIDVARKYLEATLPHLEPQTTPRHALNDDLVQHPAIPLTNLEIVLSLWNDVHAPIDSNLLIEIRQHSDHPAVSLLASALHDVDSVWHGKLPRHSWLTTGDPLPYSDVHLTPDFVDISGAVLLAHALTVSISGEHALRRKELEALAQQTLRSEMHQRWLQHFFAASTAIACGALERAQVEWKLMMAYAPRFIPARLRWYLQRILESLRSVAAVEKADTASPNASQPVVWQMFRYLAGKHAVLAQQISLLPTDQLTLPILRLGAAHLAAVEHENPVELMRIGDRLRQLELWAPAAFALTRARDIFLARRTARGIGHSTQLLTELEARLHEQAPWHRPGALPTSDYIRLTPRELITAQLAAEGLSNREIAERLHCSVRTVESHIAQARAKLGAPTRKELVGLLARHTEAAHARPQS